MGLFDFFKPKPPSISEQHKQNSRLCIPHLQWRRCDDGDYDEWELYCAVCGRKRGATFFDTETGQRKLQWQFWFGVGGTGQPNTAYPSYNDPLQKLLLEKFPDARQHNEHNATIAQAEHQTRIEQCEAECEVRRQENFAKPHCPTCNSTEVQKISNAKRIASTAVMGIASSTIGKSYECKKCGYKW